MGANSQKAFTTDKLQKFAASGKNNGGNGDKGASADDYGRAAAKTSDCSAFATGGAARAPSLGRAARAAGGRIGRSLGGQATAKDEFTQAGRTMANEDASGKDRFTGENYPPTRAKGGRVARANGGKTRDISKVTDGGPKSYGDRPLIRAKGGRIGRWRGGPERDVLGQKDVYAEQKPEWLDTSIPGQHEYYDFITGGLGGRSVGAPKGQGGIGSDEAAEPPRQAAGGRVPRARGGRTKGKGKGKTVVNVIVGHGQGQQPPAPPPMAAPGPVPPPMPPPRPPMPPVGPPGAGPGGPPPMGPPPGAPMGPAGAPPGGMPPGLPPHMMPPGMPGRASGGRISQKFGAGSGQGRMANAKRNNSGKIELAE
jgi:hypothetical protein